VTAVSPHALVLRTLDDLDPVARDQLLVAAERAAVETRLHGRRAVAYRLEEEQRARLLPFSGGRGVPMSSIAAAAIRAAMGEGGAT